MKNFAILALLGVLSTTSALKMQELGQLNQMTDADMEAAMELEEGGDESEDANE